MKGTVHYEDRGNIALLSIDNPPVNPLSSGVRQGLYDGVTRALADDGIRALVISVGFDISIVRSCNLSKMHKLGRDLLNALLQKCDVTSVEEINALRIETQYLKIDILVIINSSLYLIIEDKTYTQEHGEQIKRYKCALKKEENISDENKIVAVYVKTGNESRWKLPEIADGHCKMTS